jgi:fructose-1,6-bisphosphatase/inositol monophosphatase family enzyme
MSRTETSLDPAAVAEHIRAVAATEILPRWRNLREGDVALKTGPDDLVTVADKAAEAALTERLLDLMPGSRVVGEEAVAADATIMARFDDGAPLWVIDPVDGTQAFATGEPEFTVMVGLVADRTPLAGWIYAPATGVMHWATRGAGAWRASAGGAGQRLAPPPSPPGIAECRGVVGRRMLDRERLARIEAQAHHFRELVPATYAGHQYPWLFEGAIHFCLYSKCEPWDHLPGLAIASELGLVYTKHDGSPYLPGDNRGGLIVGHRLDQLDAIRARLLGT